MSDYIDLGEDSILFNNSFELLYFLKNESYFSSVIVVDKRNQNKHGLQVLLVFFYIYPLFLLLDYQ